MSSGYMDPIVEKVIDEYKERSEFGMEKYGVPMTRTDIDLLGWLQHLKEEMMDATIYIERIQEELHTTRDKKISSLYHSKTNDDLPHTQESHLPPNGGG